MMECQRLVRYSDLFDYQMATNVLLLCLENAALLYSHHQVHFVAVDVEIPS